MATATISEQTRGMEATVAGETLGNILAEAMAKQRVGRYLCGIYLIECLPTKQKYVGKSNDIKTRWCAHTLALRRGVHYNRLLQQAWNEHGEKAFAFTVLEPCGESWLFQREAHWMRELKPSLNIIGLASASKSWWGATEIDDLTETEFWKWFDQRYMPSNDVMACCRRVPMRHSFGRSDRVVAVFR
jgi:hypothetical protein